MKSFIPSLLSASILVCPVVAHSWNQGSSGGTLGFGAMRVTQAGTYTFSYEIFPGAPDHIASGVQMWVMNWDMLITDPLYFKLKSEYMVAYSRSDISLTTGFSTHLNPGRYIFVYGPTVGFTHDSPSDPGHDVTVSGPPGHQVIGEWAGDASNFRLDCFQQQQSPCPPPTPGQPGMIGKISAVWDTATVVALDVMNAFADAKVVCKFGPSLYPAACQVATTAVSEVSRGQTPIRVAPNPFRATQRIELSLSTSGHATVIIVDVAGRTIRKLLDDWHYAGDVSVSWDGRDDHGNSVPSGTYFYRVLLNRRPIGSRGSIIVH